VLTAWDADVRDLMEFAWTVPKPWWEPNEPLASLGLLLRPFDPYPDTPPQAYPILSSGVDGEHWSAMAAGNASGYVIVMTVPFSVGVNLIVGESLSELLALGCDSHFTSLSRLAEDITAEFEPELAESAPVMAALRNRFGLSPWADRVGRLRELEARYGRPEGRVPRDSAADAELVRRGQELPEQFEALAREMRRLRGDFA
jgi:hypothetical protein